MNMTKNTPDAIQSLKYQLNEVGFQLAGEQEWRELADHIEVHKYLINQDIKRPVTWEEAVFSWLENVYRPLSYAIDRWEIRRAFPGKTDGQLYLAISTHWHFLKERNPSVTPEDAARDFAAQYGTGIASWFSRILQPAI